MQKVSVVVILGIVLAVGAGCSKSSLEKANADFTFISVVGKWNLVADSTLAGVGAQASYTIRMGTTDDYWDFRDDGKVYIKEGNKLDTAGYTRYGTNEISIERFGWIFNNQQTHSTIRELTAHSLIIHSADILPPGGVNVRTVYLKR